MYTGWLLFLFMKYEFDWWVETYVTFDGVFLGHEGPFSGFSFMFSISCAFQYISFLYFLSHTFMQSSVTKTVIVVPLFRISRISVRMYQRVLLQWLCAPLEIVGLFVSQCFGYSTLSPLSINAPKFANEHKATWCLTNTWWFWWLSSPTHTYIPIGCYFLWS